MICTKCDKNMDKCTCADAPERIQAVLDCKYVYIGQEYRERLLKHKKEVEEQKATAE